MLRRPIETNAVSVQVPVPEFLVSSGASKSRLCPIGTQTVFASQTVGQLVANLWSGRCDVPKRRHLLRLLVACICANVLIAFSVYAIGYRGLTFLVLVVAFSLLTFVIGASRYWNFWHGNDK